jgi:hypothetical protein
MEDARPWPRTLTVMVVVFAVVLTVALWLFGDRIYDVLTPLHKLL